MISMISMTPTPRRYIVQRRHRIIGRCASVLLLLCQLRSVTLQVVREIAAAASAREAYYGAEARACRSQGGF